jgi:hypothetical protein
MSIRELYDQISIEHIREFIAEAQEENLNLDFKIVNRPDFTHSDDKKNFAKALSGFANSNGGLLIWGVDARKNAEGIDCASAIREIAPYQLFLSRLNEFTGMAVSPILDGVIHKPLPLSEESGLVVTYIPESISGPHMAKMKEDRYYKRSGDSFYKMEHFDIEDMFGRRKKPKLFLVPTVKGKGRDLKVTLSIRNDGKGSAKAPYLAFDVNNPFIFNQYGLNGNGFHGMKRLMHAGAGLNITFGEDNTFVIHPGISHDVTSIWLGLGAENAPDRDLEISYMLTAEDMQVVESVLVVPLEELN